MVKNRIVLAVVLVASFANISADGLDTAKALANNKAVQATALALAFSAWNGHKEGKPVVSAGKDKKNESEYILNLFGFKVGFEPGKGILGFFTDSKFNLDTDHKITSGQALVGAGVMTVAHLVLSKASCAPNADSPVAK